MGLGLIILPGAPSSTLYPYQECLHTRISLNTYQLELEFWETIEAGISIHRAPSSTTEDNLLNPFNPRAESFVPTNESNTVPRILS